MPGWHEITSKIPEDDLAVIGIVEEQHGERARLFMQWHEIDWPVLVDSFNLLGVRAVPITALVDEHGIVRSVGPKPDELDAFLKAAYAPSAPEPAADEEWRPDVPDAVLRGSPASYGGTIRTWRDRESPAAAEEFALGVLLRKRFDSELREPGDFAAAAAAWARALERNPNQYIWRRRIQQYGPRLDKPYPFYDWVMQARADIAARGETPVALSAEPSGAEIAAPRRPGGDTEGSADIGPAAIEHPDPDGRVAADSASLMLADAAVIPSTDPGSRAARVHLTFTPNPKRHAHWNNEAGQSVFWSDPTPASGRPAPTPIVLPPPASDPDSGQPPPVDSAPRRIEFEIELPEDFRSRIDPLDLGALYFFACEDADGQCLFLRKPINLAPPP